VTSSRNSAQTANFSTLRQVEAVVWRGVGKNAAMTVPSFSGPQHAAPSRVSRRALLIAIASVGGLLILGLLGAIITGMFHGPTKATTTSALGESTSSPTMPVGSPTPAASPSSDQPSPQPSPTQSAVTRSPITPASSEICRVTGNGSTYYLYVTSAAAHNFKACTGGTPYSGSLDQLLSSGFGMDRRCVVDSTAQTGATVAVYSDTAHGDIKAAQAYCRANGGGDEG
jgi:hypothetical protein